MASFNDPTNSSLYTTVLSTLRSLIASCAKMDFSGDTNVPTGAIQHNTTTLVFEKWNGSAWAALTMRLANAAWLQWRDAGGTAVDVMRMDSADNTEINAKTGKMVEVLVNGVQQAAFDGVGSLFLNTTTRRNNARLSNDFDGNSAGGLGLNDTGSVNGSAYIGFLSGGTFRGSITNNNNTAVAYNTTSDYRLKEVLGPIGGALDKLKRLRPKVWIWKETGRTGHGFIAHELAEVEPDAVTGEKDAVDADGNPVYQAVDPRFLVATLTAALQEEVMLREALEARLAALEAKLS